MKYCEFSVVNFVLGNFKVFLCWIFNADPPRQIENAAMARAEEQTLGS